MHIFHSSKGLISHHRVPCSPLSAVTMWHAAPVSHHHMTCCSCQPSPHDMPPPCQSSPCDMLCLPAITTKHAAPSQPSARDILHLSAITKWHDAPVSIHHFLRCHCLPSQLLRCPWQPSPHVTQPPVSHHHMQHSPLSAIITCNAAPCKLSPHATQPPASRHHMQRCPLSAITTCHAAPCQPSPHTMLHPVSHHHMQHSHLSAITTCHAAPVSRHHMLRCPLSAVRKLSSCTPTDNNLVPHVHMHITTDSQTPPLP